MLRGEDAVIAGAKSNKTLETLVLGDLEYKT